MHRPIQRKNAPVLFDHETGLSRSMGDQKVFNKILEIFLVTCSDIEQNMVDAVNAQNYQHLAIILHKLRGTAATVSAEVLSVEAGRLVEQLQEQNLNSEINISDFLQILKNTKKTITSYLQKHP